MKKTNAKKKLIPAAAMLAISAAMLSTATYAWFTMSRSVEVTGIDMTATVPAGLQISLGKGQNTGNKLDVDSDSAAVGSKTITVPENTDSSPDWTNSVSFANFYFVGKLAPASSTTGYDIFYTQDVTGVGKTVASNATFYSAINGDNKDKENAFVEPKGYTVATDTALKETANSDGYYIEFPVWFRNAENDDVDLKLTAVTQPLSGSTNPLYKSARLTIYKDGATSSKLVLPKDNEKTGTDAGDYYGDKINTSGGSAVINGAVAKPGTIGATTDGIYVNVKDATNSTVYDGTSAIVTVPGKSSKSASTAATLYGDSVKYIVRLWLEGEDKQCYNANAGQSFSVSLYFDALD